MTLEEIHALKTGDRVELTFVVEIEKVDHSDNIMPVSAIGPNQPSRWYYAEDFAHAKVLPTPLKVGDRVTWGSGSYGVPIVHLDDEAKIAVVYESGVARAIDVALLRRPDA